MPSLTDYITKNPLLNGIKFSLDVPEMAEEPSTSLQGVLLHVPLKKIKPNADIKAAQEHNIQWAIHCGLAKEGDKRLKANLASAIGHLCCKENTAEVSLYTDFSLLFFVFLDDILDEEWKSIEQQDLKKAFDLFFDLLKGENKTNLPHLQFPKFLSICHALKDINRRLANTKIDKKLLLASLKQHFNFCIKEFNSRINHHSLSASDYLKIHSITLGTDLFQELVFYVRGLTLPEEIYHQALFVEFKRYQLEVMSLTNNLLSFVKELQQGKSENYILIRKREDQVSLQKVFNDIVGTYNEKIIKMLALMDTLEETYKNNNLCEMVSFMWENVHANVEWSLATARYQQKKLTKEEIDLKNLNPVELRGLLLINKVSYFSDFTK
jgi:hypothetical protein